MRGLEHRLQRLEAALPRSIDEMSYSELVAILPHIDTMSECELLCLLGGEPTPEKNGECATLNTA